MDYVDKWAAYRDIVKNNEKNKRKIERLNNPNKSNNYNTIKIDNWCDYFNLINEKLNIEISNDMQKQLIKYDIEVNILNNSKLKNDLELKANLSE